MPRTPEYEVGEEVWYYDEQIVTIIEVDLRTHGFDDYVIKDESGSEFWADSSELSKKGEKID